MKTCSKCGIEKDESEFYKVYSWCKNCKNEYVRKYNQSEKRKEYMRKYNQSEKRKEYMLKHNQSDERKEYLRKHNQSDEHKASLMRYRYKMYHGVILTPELVEVKLIINKTKQLCKTLKN